MLGLTGDPHHNPIHELSNWFIFGGLIFLGFTWRFLHSAQRRGVIAVNGPYAYVRHPQYVAFSVILFGFLLQWPTLLTLVMFPILVRMYIWLARQEEQESLEQFGEDYAAYAAVTPRFFPRVGR